MPRIRILDFKVLPSDAPHLEKLSADHRAILEAEGSYEDKAASLNIPLGTVRSRLNRARAKLIALRETEPAPQEAS